MPALQWFHALKMTEQSSSRANRAKEGWHRRGRTQEEGSPSCAPTQSMPNCFPCSFIYSFIFILPIFLLYSSNIGNVYEIQQRNTYSTQRQSQEKERNAAGCDIVLAFMIKKELIMG